VSKIANLLAKLLVSSEYGMARTLIKRDRDVPFTDQGIVERTTLLALCLWDFPWLRACPALAHQESKHR
jgi:hypothetical protein